jgi:hypothetical protein
VKPHCRSSGVKKGAFRTCLAVSQQNWLFGLHSNKHNVHIVDSHLDDVELDLQPLSPRRGAAGGGAAGGGASALKRAALYTSAVPTSWMVARTGARSPNTHVSRDVVILKRHFTMPRVV